MVMANQAVIATSGRRKTKTQEIRQAVGGATEDGEGEGNTGPCGNVVYIIHNIVIFLMMQTYNLNIIFVFSAHYICMVKIIKHMQYFYYFCETYILGNYRN